MASRHDTSAQQPVTINDLDFLLVEIPRTESADPVRSLLVRVTTDVGVEGWGEADLAWRPDELAPRRELLLPALAGKSIFDTEDLHTLEVLTSRPLRCAVEMACWDAVGRTVGRPLHELLGGNFRQRIPLAVRLSGSTDEQMVGLARELAEQGFHTQVLSSSGQAQRDLAMLRSVRQGVGDRVELRLDAAEAYDMEAARDLCAELDFDGLQLLIDPLAGGELHPVASLGRQTTVPLAVWRAIGGPADVLGALRSGAAGCVVIDLQRVGGILPARKCAAVVEAGGVTALLAGGPSVGVATAAMLQLAAATPAFSSCNESAYHQLHDDVLAEPLETIDGMLAVPQGPGLGVEIDRAKVERYQVT